MRGLGPEGDMKTAGPALTTASDCIRKWVKDKLRRSNVNRGEAIQRVTELSYRSLT